MRQNRVVRVAARLLLLSVPSAPQAAAQIAPGDALWSANDLLSGPGGFEIVHLELGTTTVVTGLTTSEQGELFAHRLDPIDGSLLCSESAHLQRITLAGAAIATKQTLFDLGAGLYIGGCDYDRDGNIFASVNAFGAGGSTIYRVDAQSGLKSLWAVNPLFDEIYNSLAIDDTTNTLWALSRRIGFAFPTRLMKTPIEGGPSWTEIVAVPSNAADGLDTDEAGNVYFADEFGDYHHYDAASGQLTTVPLSIELSESPEWLAVDDRDGSLHIVMRGTGILSKYNTGGYYVHDPVAGTSTEIVDQCDTGDPFGVVVNDYFDQTSAFPKSISVSKLTRFSAAMHGHAGEPAGVAAVAVNGAPIPPFLLAPPAFCDGGGFVSAALLFPPGALPAGFTITVQGARIDNVSGLLVFGTSVDVVTVP